MLDKQRVQFEALALKGLEALVRSWKTVLVLAAFTVVGPVLFHALHTQAPLERGLRWYFLLNLIAFWYPVILSIFAE